MRRSDPRQVQRTDGARRGAYNPMPTLIDIYSSEVRCMLIVRTLGSDHPGKAYKWCLDWLLLFSLAPDGKR
jgi:hypothetical protein